MRVYIVNGGQEYDDMFLDRGWSIALDIKYADLIQFTGGADVSPDLYDEERHPSVYPNQERDEEESIIYHQTSKPCAGICRGGQLLNVLNNGKLYQDVDGHAIMGTHSAIIEESGKVIQVTSTHHQMMRAGGGGEVLMYAGRSDVREHMLDGRVHRLEGEHDDVEAVLYEDTKSLCFQPHPEMERSPEECTDYYFELLDRLMRL